MNYRNRCPCNKIPYYSEGEAYFALSTAVNNGKKKRKESRIYKCTVCTEVDTWHLTSEEQKRSR